jgi:hypothetical protein
MLPRVLSRIASDNVRTNPNIKRTKRAFRRIFQIDDVSASGENRFRLGWAHHAREHQIDTAWVTLLVLSTYGKNYRLTLSFSFHHSEVVHQGIERARQAEGFQECPRR